LTQI